MGRILAALLVALCTACASSASGSGGAGDARSVTAVWLPDMGTQQPRMTTHGTAAQARALRRDVAAAPKYQGQVACSSSAGVSVELAIKSGDGTQHATVYLTGCAGILLPPAKQLRQLTPAVAADLKPIAPDYWQKWLPT